MHRCILCGSLSSARDIKLEYTNHGREQNSTNVPFEFINSAEGCTLEHPRSSTHHTSHITDFTAFQTSCREYLINLIKEF